MGVRSPRRRGFGGGEASECADTDGFPVTHPWAPAASVEAGDNSPRIPATRWHVPHLDRRRSAFATAGTDRLRYSRQEQASKWFGDIRR